MKWILPLLLVTLLGACAPDPKHAQHEVRAQVEKTMGSAETRIEILDVSGRRLRAFTLGRLAAGDHAVTWDGRDAAGKRANAGAYVVHLVSGTSERRLRIVRL